MVERCILEIAKTQESSRYIYKHCTHASTMLNAFALPIMYAQNYASIICPPLKITQPESESNDPV